MIDIQRYRRTLLVVYSVVLLGMTLAPVPAGGPVTHLDKLVHLGMFAGLAVLFFWNLLPVVHALKAAALATLATMFTAGLIEAFQDPLPYRSGDVGDFLAGAIGALLGAVTALAIHRDPNA